MSQFTLEDSNMPPKVPEQLIQTYLCQGRYKAFLVEDAGYFWSLSRYIHLTPCNGNRPLVQAPGQWAYSSYPGFTRKTSRVDWVQYDELHTYWQSQNSGKDPAAAYRQCVKAERIDPEDPLTSTLSGWVPGSESF